ncbi:MAG TPA: hypothetical protein PLQ54_20825, partial [Armatimonadota bacterium]|nr:hypothetical protein [Armatimonadota bacterium]
DPPQAQVLVQYDLSSAAASCGIKVYPPCLGPAPVVFPSEGNLGSDRGHHIQSVRLQVCPTHMGPYAFALCAGETTASGQEHRGRAAKPALPRGAGMAIWPPAYGGAGDDGPGSPYNDDLSGAVAEFQQQLGIPQGLGGLHWAPASGAGPDQVDAVFARMSEGPAAVVYAAAHATSHLLDFEDGRVLDLEYVLSDCTIPDSQASHAISELQGNDLRECLLVMFQGCHTATGHILSDAVVGKGAQAFVGFEGEPLLEYHDEFAHGFWPMASQPGKDLAEALDLAVDYLLVVKGASGGFETMWCTDASLELFPPRFSGPCVRAR